MFATSGPPRAVNVAGRVSQSNRRGLWGVWGEADSDGSAPFVERLLPAVASAVAADDCGHAFLCDADRGEAGGDHIPQSHWLRPAALGVNVGVTVPSQPAARGAAVKAWLNRFKCAERHGTETVMVASVK